MKQVPEETALGVVQRDTGLIAGGLYAEYQHGA
jgi:hypothetical protein